MALIYPERQHGAVGRTPGNMYGYHGWPSVAADGAELYAVCSGYRMAHVCPFGKTLLYKSADGGASWSVPRVVNDTVLDDRDAGIVNLGGGKLLVSWFVHPARVYLEQYSGHIEHDVAPDEAPIAAAQLQSWKKYLDKPELSGSFIRVSADRGETWGETVRVPVSAPHGPIVLPGGRLLYVGVEMYCPDEVPGCTAAYVSDDGGASWSCLSQLPIPCPPSEKTGGYYEPHAAVLPSGRIIAAVRAETKYLKHGFTVVTCVSDDGGKTWSQPKDTGAEGSPPHLLLHSSGALIMSIGRRSEPFGERALVSYDGGETWPDEYVLRDDAPNPDLGYPATAELPDGSLVTVYYQLYSEADGKKNSILCTRWRLNA